MPDANTSLSAFLDAEGSHRPAYLEGQQTTQSQTPAYLGGGGSGTTSISGYLFGAILSKANAPVFLAGVNSAVGSRRAYLNGILRASVSGFLQGSITGDDTVARDYIVLKTSDGSLEKRFRVIAQDYDDGTPAKAGKARRTLGGGMSYSAGGVYYSWSPTIKVRHTEPETDYGNLADLTYLYELNNPNGTPSDKLTFIDHHNVERTVIMPGELRKAVLGSAIEGEEAWYFVRLTLQEITDA